MKSPSIHRLLFVALIVVGPANQVDADDRAARLRDDFAELAPASGSPRSFRAGDAHRVPRGQFFSTYRTLFELGRDDAMVELANPAAVGAFHHTRYVQHYRDVPVLGAEYSVTELDGKVVLGLGRTIGGLSLSVTPARSEADAESVSTRYLAGHYGISDDDVVAMPAPPLTALVIESPDPALGAASYRLAWRVIRDTWTPLGRHIIDVDAQTGALLRFTTTDADAWVNAPVDGLSLFDGTVTMTAEKETTTGQLRLHETGVIDLITLDAQGTAENSVTSSTGAEVTSTGNTYPSSTTQAAVTAHWAAERTLEFLFSQYGRDGFDGNGGTLHNFVHVNFSDPNARWVSAIDGVLYSQTPDFVALDIVAHEIGHGVVGKEAGWVLAPGLEYQGESGALNEHFADVLSTVVTRQTTGNATDYTLGEQLYPGTGLRRLDAPNTPNYAGTSSPDTYQAPPYWIAPSDPWDHGGVHENCGVPNFGFYLLAEGGTGTNDKGDAYAVTKINPWNAARVAYTMIPKLGNTATMADAREAARQSAIELYGEHSQEHISVTNAWYAVGIGAVYTGPPSTPAAMATGVDPWKTHFAWWPGLGDTKWDIQIATGPDFATQTIFADTTTVPNADVLLQPEAGYYWRVRRATSDPLVEGWRPALFFTTGAKAGETVGPNAETEVHPWNLTFTWKQVPGATGYIIEVAKDPDFNDLVTDKTPPVAGVSTELDTLVDSDQYWRVRPVVEADGGTLIEGKPSPAQLFHTKMPKVIAIGPVDMEAVHPWPVHFEWNGVTGADHYIVEVARDENSWGEDSLLASLTVDDPETTKDLNMRPQYNHDNVIVFWRVRVVGPPLFEDVESSAEEGDPSDMEMFQNAGDSTLVTMTQPLTGDTVNCCDQRITVKWDRVPGAVEYYIDHRLMYDHHGTVEMQEQLRVVPDDPDAPTVSGQIMIAAYSGVSYYAFNVRAIGPEDIEGLGAENWGEQILLIPKAPEILGPSGSDVAAGETTLEFSEVWSPSSDFLVEIWFGGTSCDVGGGGLPVQVMSSDGTFPLDVPNDLAVSWRVKAFSDHELQSALITSKYPWSDCSTFSTVPEPPPPPVITAPNSGDTLSYASTFNLCWEEVDDATDYEASFVQVDGAVDVYQFPKTDATPGGANELCIEVVPKDNGDTFVCGTYGFAMRSKRDELWSETSSQVTVDITGCPEERAPAPGRRDRRRVKKSGPIAIRGAGHSR